MAQDTTPSHQPTDGRTIVAIGDAENPFVKMGAEYWQSRRGQRRFPARDDLTLRGMATILPYAVIANVIDDGADYEYRYVGDAQQQAFKTYFKGLRVKQIEATAPELGKVLRSAYEQVRSTGTPFIVRGRVDSAPPDSKFSYHETAFLPLGTSDASVDSLLIVGVQVPDPFWAFSEDKLNTFADLARASGTMP